MEQKCNDKEKFKKTKLNKNRQNVITTSHAFSRKLIEQYRNKISSFLFIFLVLLSNISHLKRLELEAVAPMCS